MVSSTAMLTLAYTVAATNAMTWYTGLKAIGDRNTPLNPKPSTI